jgi:protein-L-isoaspartate(D-aspartate) O-methyltransferase
MLIKVSTLLYFLIIILKLDFCMMIGSSAKKAERMHLLNKLVDSLVSKGAVFSQKVNHVMRTVDRGDFYHGSGAYDDCPQPIGYNATISAPHMHAYCLEWLSDVLVPGAKVLDVGSGSGYLVAAFFEMIEKKG